jgi:hypothetical protein
MRKTRRWFLVLVACIASAAHAQHCPSDSVEVGRKQIGNTIQLQCRCLQEGFTVINGECVSPSRPIFDCGHLAETLQRIKAGLGPQEDAVKRMETEIAALKSENQEIGAEATRLVVKDGYDALYTYSRSYLSQARQLRERLHALDLEGFSYKEKDLTIRVSGRLDRAYDAVDHATKTREAFDAGYSLGANSFAKRLADQSALLSDTLRETEQIVLELMATHKLELLQILDESGLLVEGGATAARTLGPLGELSFKAANLTIHLSYLAGKAYYNAEERARLEGNLDTMRHELSERRSEIKEREDILANKKNCT